VIGEVSSFEDTKSILVLLSVAIDASSTEVAVGQELDTVVLHLHTSNTLHISSGSGVRVRVESKDVGFILS